jgi:hypothetical protein
MAFDIFVLLLAASHVVTVALLVLWIGLKKPTSFREFWRRFHNEFLSLTPKDMA